MSGGEREGRCVPYLPLLVLFRSLPALLEELGREVTAELLLRLLLSGLTLLAERLLPEEGR